MKKTIMYVYLGTNGTICSPVHLEGIYYVRKYYLNAEQGKALTKGDGSFVQSIIVPEDEVALWYEVDRNQGQD